jgi:ABC-type transporter Mla subunit MlaD
MSNLIERLERMADPTSTDNEWRTIAEAAAALRSAAAREAALVEALEWAETSLNEIRDTMLDDRDHYADLVDFAADVEGVAARARAELAAAKGENHDAG